MSGYADMFNKKHGSAVKAKDPTGILPGQAMDKKGRIPFADPKAKGKADKGAKADPNVQKQLKALAAENAELKKQINQLMIQLKKGGA